VAPLDQFAHRPWPLPTGPWVMAQGWDDLLFAHWPIPVDALRALIPEALTIDTFDGVAWLGIVPFSMRRVRLRLLPSMPGLSHFPELNVRTYVTYGGKPGVWFFSLDAANRVAVAAARRWFHLPYFHARMISCREDASIHYRSQRIQPSAPPALLAARYTFTGPATRTAPGSLEHWLTERYCLYCVDGRGQLARGEIHHAPWPLQPAEAEVRVNSMAQAAGLTLPDTPPLLHFAARQDVVVWPIQRADTAPELA
jgi:uncharacterized protein YqjF (DUF2071 family)